MKKNRFLFAFILLLIGQVCIYNFFRLTQFVTLSILPAMIMMIPIKRDTVATLIISFISAFAVDFFAEGTLGINALSLVPVALLRKPVIELFFGSEPFEQKENISVRKYGFARVSMAVMLMTMLFLTIYTLADCAGTRPFWFIATKVGLSTAAGYLASICIINLLAYEDRR